MQNDEKTENTEKIQNGTAPASKHPILSNFLRYYLLTCVFVGACFWFIPTQPLVPEEGEPAKIVVYHSIPELENSGIVVQTDIESKSYEYAAEDTEFQQILDVLQDKSCRRTFRGLFA